MVPGRRPHLLKPPRTATHCHRHERASRGAVAPTGKCARTVMAARPADATQSRQMSVVLRSAADLIGAPLPSCLVVSGNIWQLCTARRVGARGLGCTGGRDRRKHLAAYAPVISRLAPSARPCCTTDHTLRSQHNSKMSPSGGAPRLPWTSRVSATTNPHHPPPARINASAPGAAELDT